MKSHSNEIHAAQSDSTRLTRRTALKSLATGLLGSAALGAGGVAMAQSAPRPRAAAGTASHSRMPYAGVRIFEKSETLAGRLTGLLFADQGAEVYVERGKGRKQGELDDTYFDRGKLAVPQGGLSDLSSADVIIVDGDVKVDRKKDQILVRISAALPGDEVYGYLEPDCSEDLVNAVVGFFTNMSITGPILGRPVIYTPLPLCSVYTGVNTAVALGASLVDRLRSGEGREIHASRIASGLSAIGALSLTSEGLPKHLEPIIVGGLPPGADPAEFMAIVEEAKTNPARQLWLEQRFAPLAAPYRAKDGQFFLPMAAPNRRLTQWALEALGLWQKALDLGMVDVSPYDPDNFENARRNLADSMALRFDLTNQLADMIEAEFAKRTAVEWEAEFTRVGIPSTVVQTWEEWKDDRTAVLARIFAPVEGDADLQIGRASWVQSAQPYPPLKVAKKIDAVPSKTAPTKEFGTAKKSHLPLAGYVLVDLSSVVAGPNCGRMFAELGATTYKIDSIAPNGSPTIVVTWSGEASVGKQSLILDLGTREGAGILRKLIAQADFVLANLLDDQMARLRLDPVSMARVNSKLIGVQISAHRGEQVGPRHNQKGFDPALQGTVGIMKRFGPEGSPTYHGIASCVDYLCGYLGTWAGVTALYAREFRGDNTGDWASTSLSTAATLTQLLLQRDSSLPKTALAEKATGMNEGERVYQLSDGWIFAQASKDITAELEGKDVATALAELRTKGVPATPVQTCQEVAAKHGANPTSTIDFQELERDGWKTACFAPSWFCFDGKPLRRPAAPPRIGSDAPAVLRELGYSDAEITALQDSRVVGRTEWARD